MIDPFGVQLSNAVAEPKAAGLISDEQSTDELTGQLIVGFSLSVTVTVNEHVAVFPLASVTTKVLVVVPIGKVDPEAKPAVCAMV